MNTRTTDTVGAAANVLDSCAGFALEPLLRTRLLPGSLVQQTDPTEPPGPREWHDDPDDEDDVEDDDSFPDDPDEDLDDDDELDLLVQFPTSVSS